MVKLSKFNLVFSFDSSFDLVYNTLHGSLVLVDKEIGLAIKRNDLRPLLSDTEVYKQLLSVNIILDDSIVEDEVHYRLSRELRFTNKAISLFLGLTSRCNLACIYCYQSLRSSMEGCDLSEKEWRNLYGLLERRVKKETSFIAVALYGGEPLLNASMAKKVVKDLEKLASEYGTRKELSVITNGTVYNNNVEEVITTVNTIQVTVDGVKEVHDSRRPFKDGLGSFDTVVNNTLTFVDRYDKQVGIRVNVDEHNIDKAHKLVDFLADLGLQNKVIAIDMSPVHPEQVNNYTPFKTSKNYYEYYTNVSRKIVEVLEYAVEKGFKISKAFVKGPCICKYANGYAVDEKLNIYLCPAYMYGTPIGRIVDEKTIVISPERFIPVVYDPLCADNCKYAPICYGGCIYLKSKNVPTCLKMLYGEEHLERLLRVYAISKYRDLVKPSE